MPPMKRMAAEPDELQLNGVVRLHMPASPSHQLFRELLLGL